MLQTQWRAAQRWQLIYPGALHLSQTPIFTSVQTPAQTMVTEVASSISDAPEQTIGSCGE